MCCLMALACSSPVSPAGRFSGFFSVTSIDGQPLPALLAETQADSVWLLYELLAFDGTGMVTITSQVRRGPTQTRETVHQRMPYTVHGDSAWIGSDDVVVKRRGTLELLGKRYPGRRLVYGRAPEL
jgi:hypothetical protein